MTITNSCVAVKSLTITDNAQLQAGVPECYTTRVDNVRAVTVGALGVGPYTPQLDPGLQWSISIKFMCRFCIRFSLLIIWVVSKHKIIIINNSNGITGETFSVQNVVCNGTLQRSCNSNPNWRNGPNIIARINPALASTGQTLVNGLCPERILWKWPTRRVARTTSADVTATTKA